jgi:hypothetical protein
MKNKNITIGTVNLKLSQFLRLYIKNHFNKKHKNKNNYKKKNIVKNYYYHLNTRKI